MPIYEYECPLGHRAEHISLSYKDAPQYIVCLECLRIAANADDDSAETIPHILMERVWSAPANFSSSVPTVVHRDKFGRLSVPGFANEPTPPGHIREEYRGPIERAKITREFQNIEDINHSLVTEAHSQIVDEARKKRRDEIDAKVMPNLDNKGKLAMKEAREYLDKKPKAERHKQTIALKVDK